MIMPQQQFLYLAEIASHSKNYHLAGKLAYFEKRFIKNNHPGHDQY
jgi:hypothetical protein